MMIGASSTTLIQIAVVGGGLLVAVVIVLSLTYFRSATGSPTDTPVAEGMVGVSIEAVDESTGQTYPHADRVVGRRTAPVGTSGRQGESTDSDPRGVSTDSVTIELAGGQGEAELEGGLWTFEIQQNGQAIGRRQCELSDTFDSDRLTLPVDPYTVDVRVLGGPDSEPLSGAPVEATADTDEWAQRTRTGDDGRAQFEVPRPASTVTFTSDYGNLPTVESAYRIEEATQEGVTLEIGTETGAIALETVVGDRAWPGVDVRITPVSEDTTAYTDEGTVATKSGGRLTVEELPVGTYEVSAQPQIESVDTTGDTESVTVEGNERTEITLSIGVSYSVGEAERERLAELRDRIEGLASSSNRDVAIPRYYGTVLASVLDLVDAVESTPERVVGAGFPPDAVVRALLDATEAGFEAVFDAMSDRRVVSLFEACEPMEPAQVDWNGDATLDMLLDRVNEGSDHEKQILRDRLAETDSFLDQRWSEVNESAPVRKLHDRLGEVAREVDTDTELATVARAYVGLCLLDAIEELFEHDALVDRLNGRTL